MLTQHVGFASDLVQEIGEAAVGASYATAANARVSGPAVTTDTAEPRPEADLVSEPRLRASIIVDSKPLPPLLSGLQLRLPGWSCQMLGSRRKCVPAG
jgi:hypothetical protein